MKIFLMTLALFLLCPVIAEEKRSKYEPMDQDDLIQWYTNKITKSVIEDAKYIGYISTLALSRDVSCFEVHIATESYEIGHPEWHIDAANCVDKRTYQCGEK